MHTLKKFVKYYAPYRTVFFLDLICAAIISLVDLAFPQILRSLTKTLFTEDPSKILGALLPIGLALLVMYIIQTFCKYYVSYQGHMMGAHMERDMRQKLFDHYERLSFSYYDQNNSGQMMSKLVSDLFDISEFAHHGPENLFISVIKIVGSFTFLFLINWRLAIPLLVMVVFMLIFSYKQNRQMQETFMDNRRKIGDVNSSLQDTLAGIRVVQSFANEKIEREKFEKSNEGFLVSKDANYHCMGSFMSGNLFFQGMMYLITLVFGGWLIAHGKREPADLAMYALYIGIFISPIQILVELTEMMQKGLSGFRRFLDVVETEPEIVNAPDAEPLENVKGEVEYKNVSFHYSDDDTPVLDRVSFKIPAGRSIALVGPSGSGKTTICSLLPRFYDVTGGQITLDGKDIRRISMEELREEIGFVPQKGVLFSGTIASNLRFGKADATDEDIKEAAEIAQATEFIETKKEKYDSPIAQGGSNVSGGQKQRLAIARAIAKKAKVLVFDDSFSALDMKTDAALRKELNEKVQDASIVIVAQRVSTILHADQILVLDDGKIVGKGTHEELLKNCEVYLQIAKSQLSEKELGLEKLGLAEEKAEKETNKKEILSTKIDEKENNKLKEKSDDKKLKHKKGGK